jgi:hypothetical protein
LTLAVEVILQHRELAIDQVKRDCPGGWIAKLMSTTQFAINNTPEDQFSSSKNIAFSRLMKERAVKRILPSLFGFAQFYENYVFQNKLWEYEEANIPLGKIMAWRFIPRPPKQTAQRRTKSLFHASVRGPNVDTRNNKVDGNIRPHMSMLPSPANMPVSRNLWPPVNKQPIPAASFPLPSISPPSQSGMMSNGNEYNSDSSFNSFVDRLHLEEDAKGNAFAVATDPDMYQFDVMEWPSNNTSPKARSPQNPFIPVSSQLAHEPPAWHTYNHLPYYDSDLSMVHGSLVPAIQEDGIYCQYAGYDTAYGRQNL